MPAGEGQEVAAGTPDAVRRPRVPRVVGSVAEEGFLRRTQALLRTAPLHHLARNTSWKDWESSEYDPRVLSLAAIDAVIARMGFASELTYGDALSAVADLARIAAPDSPEDEHMKVAAFVLDGLLNDRDQNNSEAFTVPYSDYTEGHTRRVLRFFLLTEKALSDGRVVLVASDAAVNVFRGALSIPVEDAQMAMELVLRAQLERGDLDDAQVTAEQNQRLTYEMGAKIRGLLDATRSDISRVDWQGEVLAELDRARAHVGQRIEVEGQILAHLAAGDEAREPEVKEKSLRVANLLEACLSEHRSLHGKLMGATDIFLSEQQRQELRFRGHGLGLFSCTEHLVDPVLTSTVADAEPVTNAFVDNVGGPVAPRIPRLGDLLPLLLRPRGTTSSDDPIDDDPDFSEVQDDVETYDPNIVEAASIVLEPTLSAAVRLSELLGAARTWDPEVEELVRLSVLWAYAPEYDDDELVGALDLLDPNVMVLSTRTPLETPGWTGDDLLVGPAEMLVEDADVDVVEEVDDDEVDDEVEGQLDEEVVDEAPEDREHHHVHDRSDDAHRDDDHQRHEEHQGEQHQHDDRPEVRYDRDEIVTTAAAARAATVPS